MKFGQLIEYNTLRIPDVFSEYREAITGGNGLESILSLFKIKNVQNIETACNTRGLK